MKQQHETFVKAMAEHGDPIKSYLTAYPKATEASARTAAYRLLQDPEISKAVTFDAKHMHTKAKAAALKKGTRRVTQQLADIQKRREVLAQMIFGTLKRKRFFKLDGEIVWVEDDMPSQSILRAIELDCKLEAGFDWTGRRTTAEKKEKEQPPKPGPDNPVEPKPDDVTGVIILIGDHLFESGDAEWIERYIAWKKANPDKVKEWTVETPERVDRYIELDENYEGLQRNWKRNGTHSLIQVMRFGDGLPRGPFIPGESRYFLNYKEQEAAYGSKPYKAPAPASGSGNSNSSLDLNANDLMSEGNNSREHSVEDRHGLNSPFQGGHLVADKMGGCLHNTERATPDAANKNLHFGQQNVTIQPYSNPPLSANMPENRKVYYNSDELWEAYKAALPAWPHLSEKTRRFTEQYFKNADMSQQRLLLSLKQGGAQDKNTAA
ncbi:MAG: hypothetical protein K0R82_812 [Flavipsychrobacter sp.]|jgi:hypothetical protein|nr:hypothetical protein [Flavipsychrobacter sp.]